MANVFFGCSMRGGYDKVSQKELGRILEIIEELGNTILSKHQTQENIFEEEDKLTKTEIFERDYEWLLGADAGIFEITNASTGTGAEITHLSGMQKHVLCLYKEQHLTTTSAYVLGMQGSKYLSGPFECSPYHTLDDAKGIIKRFLDANCRTNFV